MEWRNLLDIKKYSIDTFEWYFVIFVIRTSFATTEPSETKIGYLWKNWIFQYTQKHSHDYDKSQVLWNILYVSLPPPVSKWLKDIEVKLDAVDILLLTFPTRYQIKIWKVLYIFAADWLPFLSTLSKSVCYRIFGSGNYVT